MAKTRKPNDGQVVKKIQKQFENLFSKPDEPPGPISVQQAEALKARIGELETQLVGQSDTAEKKVSTIVQETAPRSSPARPAKESRANTAKQTAMNQQLRLPENPAFRARNVFLIAMLIAVPHFVAVLYYLYLGRTTGPPFHLRSARHVLAPTSPQDRLADNSASCT